MAVRGRGEGEREGMKELVAKRQRAGRGRGEREKEREGGGWLAGWLVGEREDGMDEKGGGAGWGKLVFPADKNVNLKIRR